MAGTIMEYLKQVRIAELKHPEWRHGQAMFNVLYDMNPRLADRIRGTDLDPFHKKEGAELIPFWSFIRENLNP
jgi:hypothetical protein